MTATLRSGAAPRSLTLDERRSQVAELIAIALVRCRRRERLDGHWTGKGVAIEAAESVYANPSRPSPKVR